MDPHPLFGQFKTNKNGGVYQNGKPLDEETRKSIVEMKQRGVGVKRIGEVHKVSHAVVSKILKNWTATGSLEPRKRQIPARAPEIKKEGFSVQELLAVPFKKPRALYEPGQLARLEALFLAQMYPNEEQKMQLEQETGLSRQQIDTWFNNKRCRLRKKVVGAVVSSKSASTSSFVPSVTSPVSPTQEAVVPSCSDAETENIEVDVVGNLNLTVEKKNENFIEQPKRTKSCELPSSRPSIISTPSPMPSIPFLQSTAATSFPPLTITPPPTFPFFLPHLATPVVDANAYAFYIASLSAMTNSK